MFSTLIVQKFGRTCAVKINKNEPSVKITEELVEDMKLMN